MSNLEACRGGLGSTTASKGADVLTHCCWRSEVEDSSWSASFLFGSFERHNVFFFFKGLYFFVCVCGY